ncbi:MAG: OmpA family protein [Chitinophagales bacterium]|nr:OmpA family protein [Chitinophagales bacterium]
MESPNHLSVRKLKQFIIYKLLLIIFPISLTAQSVSINVQSETIKPGAYFEVKVNSSGTLNEHSWIGIFDINANTSSYYSYEYIGERTNQSIKMQAPPKAGSYDLRVYADDPGALLKTTTLIIERITPDEYTIKLLAQEVKPAHQFEVAFTANYAIDEKAWLGIFKWDAGDAPSSYLSYKYITPQKGENILMMAPGEIGDYELRFYSADPGMLVHRIPFRVGKPNLPGIKFELDKKSYGPGEEINLNYVGHEELSETAWVGYFKEDGEKYSYRDYLNYQYLMPKQKGILKFKAPYTKGDYVFRMYYSDTGPELLTPVPFSVTSSLDDSEIKKSLETKGKVILYGIYFDTDKSIVKAASYPLIEEIAEMLKDDSSISIQVEGHTDNQGETGYNQVLSEKRAAAVVNLLVDKYGVKASQLKSTGFGETKPIADNKNSTGRARNRRVELKRLK